MDEKFFREIRKDLEEKKKFAVELKNVIEFGEETGNLDPTAKSALVEAKAQISMFEKALKKRGF